MTARFPSHSAAPERSFARAPFFSARSTSLRRAARLVLAAWMCPLLLSLTATLSLSTAQAQVAPAPPPIVGGAPAPVQNPPEPTVVLDFSTPVGVDAVVGRKVADALAVELQRSGGFSVITRQQVEEAVANQPGLTPPFNTATQANLARAVLARSVFSGRVRSVQVDQGRSARVQIEVRQLEGSTEDYINGTLVSEISEIKLQTTPSEVLVDEAINKAAVSAVRSLRQTLLPRGVVLNVSPNDLELNIGTRNGVQPGQRYSVLRDIYNRGRNITERLKVGEVRITAVEADQSTAVVSAGGAGGVTTGDRVRRIYELTNFPVSSVAAGDGQSSVTPVTAPVRSSSGHHGGFSKGLIGIAGLAFAVLLAGVGGSGGSSSGNSPGDVTGYNTVPSDPSDGYSPFPTNANPTTGKIRVNWTSGANGPLADANDIGGYFVYRGVGGVSANTQTLQGFVTGNTRRFDDIRTNNIGHTVNIVNPNDDTTSGLPIQVENTTGALITGPFGPRSTTTDQVEAAFNETPPLSGIQYAYAVQRVSLVRITPAGGTTTSDLELSRISDPSGGITAIAGPAVVSAASNFDLDNFQVAITGRVNGTTLYNEVTQFEIQVSTSANYPSNSRTTVRLSTPTAGVNATTGNFLLIANTGVAVPGYNGTQTLHVRVGARNENDEPGDRTPFVFGSDQSFTPTAATATAAAAVTQSRFLPAEGSGRSQDGIGLGAGLGNMRRSSSTGRPLSHPHVLRPQ